MTVGQVLDTAKLSAQMGVYFSGMKELTKNPNVNLRIAIHATSTSTYLSVIIAICRARTMRSRSTIQQMQPQCVRIAK